MSYTKLDIKELQNRLDAISEEQVSVEEAIEDGKTYAWINVVTGDHGYGTKEESSNWTHYIPMSDFSYFSGDEDYKGLDDETAQEEGWIAVKESVSEDLIDAGSPLEDILEMNLFMDMLNVNPEDCPSDDEEMIAVNSDREFKGLNYLVTRGLCAKYKPIAEKLASQIEANSDRELTEDEVDMLNEVWYEASDLYQNGDVSELARIYDEQIQLVNQLLGGAKESVEEGDAELAELKDIMGRSGVMGFSA